jgi:hypothetical protein
MDKWLSPLELWLAQHSELEQLLLLQNKELDY